jgi:hypothetical protein
MISKINYALSLRQSAFAREFQIKIILKDSRKIIDKILWLTDLLFIIARIDNNKITNESETIIYFGISG